MGAASGALGACITGGDVGMGAIIGGITGTVSGYLQYLKESRAASVAAELQKTNGTNHTTGGTGYEMEGEATSATEAASSGSITEKAVKGVEVSIYDKTDRLADGFAAAASEADYSIGVTDINDAIEKLEVLSQDLARKGEYICTLNIIDHGSFDGYQTLGEGPKKWIEASKEWKKLCGFVSKDGIVELRGCLAGTDRNYLGSLGMSGNRVVQGYDSFTCFSTTPFRWYHIDSSCCGRPEI